MHNRPIEQVMVLSGGGARGAYQVGVCKHLYSTGWEPDMVLGNSIGATNGAILVAPNYDAVQDPHVREQIETPADLLEYVWLNHMLNLKLYTSFWPSIEPSRAVSQPPHLPLPELFDVLRDPDAHPQAFEDLVDQVQQELGPEIAEFTDSVSATVTAETRAAGLPERAATRGLLKFVLGLFKGRLRLPALIPRPGWHRVLEEYVDWDRLNDSEATCFGVASTDVTTGALQMFWNHLPPGAQGRETHIHVRHVLSSSSIPGVYPATKAEASAGEARYRWDGVLVANVPIAPAVDLIESVERVVVVLMAPWSERPEGPGFPPSEEETPVSGQAADEYVPTVGDALKRHLDWWMLAPLRSELRKLTDPLQRDKVKIVWPEALAQPGSPIDYLTNPLSIVDYRRDRNEQLIEVGRQDANNQGL